MIGNLTYYLLKALWLVFSVFPFPVLYVLSDIIFFFLYYIGRYRRKVVRKNLSESFPEKDIKEILRIERKFYRYFCDLTAETCKFATISEKTIKKRMKFVNIEEVNKVLDEGKSISTYMGHYGNWEWISSLPLHCSAEIVAGQIYRRLSNSAVDKLMLNNRKRMGAVNIEMRAVPRWINQQMEHRKVSIVGYIADQSPRSKDKRHYVDFLNHEVPALVGAEKITKRYGMEAYYMDVVRTERGYYEATFVKLNNHPQSLPDFELTDLYYQHLENSILRRPEFYLWTHKRFKHSRQWI